MAYELGAIWLQVIPSFDGVQDKAREEGRQAARAYAQGWAEQEKKDLGKREKLAEEAGESEGRARAHGREKAMTAAQEREVHAQNRHDERVRLEQLKAKNALSADERAHLRGMETLKEEHRAGQKAKDADYFRTSQAAEDAHRRNLAKLEAQGQKEIATAEAKGHQERRTAEQQHHARIKEANAKHFQDTLARTQNHENDLVKGREQLNNKLVELDKRGQNDLAKEQKKHNLRLDADAVRRSRANEQRTLRDFDRLQKNLLQRAVADPGGFDRAMKRVLDRVAQEGGLDQEIELGLDATKADEEIRKLQMRIAALRDGEIDVRADTAAAVTELMAIMRLVHALDNDDVDIRVDVNMGKALAELAALDAATTAAGRKQGDLADGLRHTDSVAGSAANAFRAMNGVLLAAVTIGPILIPTLLGIAGALASIATFAIAAVGAIGVGAVGLMGIGDAVGAMGDLEAEGRKTQQPASARRRSSERGIRNANRQVRNASRGVDTARTQAADNNTAALERQERAERSLARAQDDVRRAQERLTRARMEARREIEDMNNALVSGAMAEQDALYDLEEARYALFRIMQDGSATQREKDRAQLSYDIQAQQYREMQLGNTRLNEDAVDVQQRGPGGLQTVIDAERGVVDAQEKVVESQRGIVEAAENREKVQLEGLERIALAEERLADAIEDRAEATQRAAEQAAEGIGSMATAQDKLREAMRKLSPEAREFAEFLHGLRPLLENLQWSVTRGLLPGLQDGLTSIIDTYGATATGRDGRTGGPSMHDFLHDMGTLLGDIAREWGEWATKAEIVEFFELLGDYSLVFIRQFGDMMPGFMEGIFGVIEALLPFTEQFGDALLRLSEMFSEWANSDEGQEAMARFFDYLANVSPKVMELFVAAMQALAAIMIALAPHAEFLIEDVFIPFLEWITEMDPDRLQTLVLTLLAMVFAFQMFAATMALVQTSMGFWQNIKWLGGGLGKLLAFFGIGSAGKIMNAGAAAGTLGAGKAGARVLMRFGAIGLAIGLVIWGLFELYEHVEPFRNFVDGIVGALVTAWTDHIWPTLRAMFDFLVETFGPIFSWLYTDIIKPVWERITLAVDIAWTAIEIIFKLFLVAVEILGAIFSWLYNEAIKPAWDWISGHIKTVWDNHIKPVLEAFGNFIAEHVAPKIQAAVDAIGSIWESLKKLFAMPIVFVVDTIINRGIIDTLNSVFDFFDIDPVDHVSVPSGIRAAANMPWGGNRTNTAQRSGGKTGNTAMASGGILPGYSPGLDIHDFVSPTAGRLRLSGGEAILRPEVARVLGKGGVDELNGAAIRGGTSEVARVLSVAPSDPHGAPAVPQWLSDAAGWVGDMASYVWDFVTDPVGSLKKVAGNLIDKGSDWAADSVPGKVVLGAPMTLIDKAGSAISSMLGFGGAVGFGGGGGSFGSGKAGSIFGAQPWPNFAAQRVAAAVGRPGMMMQAFNQSMAGDHPQGLAVDFIDTVPILNRVAAYGAQNAEELGLRYLAWQGRLYSPGAGWRPQTTGYGNDPMHRWHVHMSFNRGPGGAAEADPLTQIRAKGPQLRDGGGAIEPGLNYILNATGETEWALTRQQLDNLRGSGGGGGGDTIFDIDIDRPGATAGEIAQELNFELRKVRRGGAHV